MKYSNPAAPGFDFAALVGSYSLICVHPRSSVVARILCAFVAKRGAQMNE
jgi:hypothetical protein